MTGCDKIHLSLQCPIWDWFARQGPLFFTSNLRIEIFIIEDWDFLLRLLNHYRFVKIYEIYPCGNSANKVYFTLRKLEILFAYSIHFPWKKNSCVILRGLSKPTMENVPDVIPRLPQQHIFIKLHSAISSYCRNCCI